MTARSPLLPPLHRLLLRAARALRGLAGRGTIARRLALAFGVVLALFAGTTAFAVLQMRAMQRDMASALQAHTEIAARAVAMRRSIDEIYLNALLLVLSTEPDDVAFHRQQIDAARAGYAKAKSQLLALTYDGRDVAGLPQAMQALGEISQAAASQSAGIAEVSDAMSDIDALTQRNAA